MNPVRKEISDIKRFDEIIRTIVAEEASYILDLLNLGHHVPFAKRVNMEKDVPPPERLRKTLEELGTTFIKFGQIMAQRPDILPKRYTEELQKLEDSVGEFPGEKARTIVDQEIGLENFKDFNEEPIAAASIAQVHRATLNDGSDVAVKIRRPGVKEQVEKDLEILHFFAKRAEKHSQRLSKLQVTEITNTFANWTRNELDLEKERRNAEKLRENLEDEEKIKIPETYAELTTQKVFTMEFIDGVKCTNTEKLQEMDIESEEIAKTTVRSGLKQCIRDGFYHADTHPSNFLIQENSHLVYLDFGMMGQLSKEMRTQLGLLFIHAANEDVKGATETIKEIGHIEPDADLDALGQEIDEKVTLIKHSRLDEHSISRELFDIAVKASQYGVHMPTSFALIAKSMTTMEGIGLAIYPEFNIGEEYEHMAEKIVLKNNAPDPKSPIIDLIQNKELIEKPFTQLRKESKEQNINVKVQQENQKGDEMITASLLLGGVFLITQQEPTLNILGTGALGLAGYQVIRQLF